MHLSYFLLGLGQIAAVSALFRAHCADPTQSALLNLAIGAAVDMVTFAKSQITINHPVVNAAVRPLMMPEDIPRVVALYDTVIGMKTSAMEIRIYCSSNHIQWDQASNKWIDGRDWTARNSITGTRLSQNYYLGSDPNNRPIPADTAGFASLGANAQGNNNDVWIGIDQAQVVILRAGDYLPGAPAGNQFDLRPIADIKASGLNERFNSIDDIFPLGSLVLHELFHVAGGLRDQFSPLTPVVDDGPNKDTYGWYKCMVANANRATMQLPWTMADCLTVVTKALYLGTINNVAQYWSLGAVAKDGSGTPLNIHGQSKRGIPWKA